MVAVSPRVLTLPGGLRVAVSHHALDCGDIALPLGASVGSERLLATTVLTRGGISDVARRNRNRQRSSRTRGDRMAKRRRPGEGRPDAATPDT
jgi:hypothetical protein